MSSVKTRFAPSPTGLVHLGNARTAYFNFLYAAATGGDFLLRIEDSDAERSKTEFVSALIEDFHWLGLPWNQGPVDATPVSDCYQSMRGEIYADYYQQLETEGRAYPCFCSPKELELSRKRQLAAGQPPRYSGKCAHLSSDEIRKKREQGQSSSLRFRVEPNDVVAFTDLVRGPQRFTGAEIGDFIIRRENGTPAFFFCNAVDDALMQVSHVLRGEDHLTNTPRQMLILRALGLRIPEYGHFALILGSDGAPLSKRNGSQSLRDLRVRGFLPEAVLNYMARLGHKLESDELRTLTQLVQEFRLESLGRAPARYDEQQLLHWQKEAVLNASSDRLAEWLGDEHLAGVPAEAREDFIGLFRSNCQFPEEAAEWSGILFGNECPLPDNSEAIINAAGSRFFTAGATLAGQYPNSYQDFLAALKEQSGLKGKALFQPLRIALSGRLDGPELARIYQIMPPALLASRFEAMAQRCAS